MDISSLFEFLQERQAVLLLRTGEHLMLAGVSTIIATVIGVALGVWGFRDERVREPMLGAVGILQTVPSLAMLVFLMALYHSIGILPALTALTLYALLPIVRNTITGLQGVSPFIMEAARGIGMTPYQQLIKVRLPLAVPIIIAGIRTAAVVGVGVATLAAFIGAGGLGEFINRGLALSNTKLILLGAIPSALLALIVDGALALVEWALKPAKPTKVFKDRNQLKLVKRAALSVPVLLIGFSSWVYLHGHPIIHDRGIVKIGTKHFSEHIILGEMMAQMIEDRTDLLVDRRFDFPGTMFCHQALLNGELDIYPEYTGTALCAILNKEAIKNKEKAFEVVDKIYQKKFKVKWLAPFGFNNTYTMVVKRDVAETHRWKTISDMAPLSSTLVAGLPAEFVERSDGLVGLKESYPIKFKSIQDLDTNITCKAVAGGEIDITAANETDGRIEAFELFRLKDDKEFFPPYEAAPIARIDILKKFPEVETALEELADIVDSKQMTRLNFEVDGKKRSPRKVVKEFLIEKGLIQEKAKTKKK